MRNFERYETCIDEMNIISHYEESLTVVINRNIYINFNSFKKIRFKDPLSIATLFLWIEHAQPATVGLCLHRLLLYRVYVVRWTTLFH